MGKNKDLNKSLFAMLFVCFLPQNRIDLIRNLCHIFYSYILKVAGPL